MSAKTWVKNIRKNLSSKYSQKLLDHAKQSATDAKRFLIMLNNRLQMHLKLLSKYQFKKQQKELVI